MKEFFKNIEFTYGTKDSEIKPSKIIISENENLTQKLNDYVYVFDSPAQTNCSFYVITVPLSEKDLFELRRYIWNENKYDLYFLAEKPESNFITTLYYAKTNPREPEKTIKSFKGHEKDAEELETIQKWQFNSGAFWMSYATLLDKTKKQRIDIELIKQLKQLKSKLQDELIQRVENPGKIVQALIDRTLFIKFLEDNHIINSFFYKHHFPDKFKADDIDSGYKTFLKEHDIENINKLFNEINKIFNDILFKTPFIKKEYLIDNKVLDFIYDAIRHQNWDDGQMSLFDFRFDVIPIEFISHIYEVFLEDKQHEEGIYYTPAKLAHLIIDDTITRTGTVLDPACGSGMFLVLAFRKLLENNPPESNNIHDKIKHKNKLLKDRIYGIEKENTAWRLAVFSLYLEILKGLPAEEIKEFIKQKLESNIDFKIFPYDISANIINCNALEVEECKIPHREKTFDYIVGNPPIFKIKPDAEERRFIDDYKLVIDEFTNYAAKVTIGGKQISQAFMLKIKDWAKPETRFGFVLNSSNFYNEKSKAFQKFFFEYYQIEEFYELSRVKKILFRKAKESVVVIIFNNKKVENNLVSYYPVNMGIFSETFDLLIIQEDKKINIFQKDILNEKIILRDYLIGNEYDLKLLDKLSNLNKLFNYLLEDKKYSFEGLKRISNKQLILYLKITDNEFNKLSKTEKVDKHEQFAKKNYLNDIETDYYNTPYIYQPENKIKPFCILDVVDGYMNIKDVNKQNFQRTRNSFIYEGKKIIFNRFGKKIEASFAIPDLFFSNLIYGIKLQNENLYNLFTAILNSDLVNYYLSQKYRKRVDGNFANLDTKAIKNIPIPKYLDEDLVAEISEISQKLTEGKLKYEGKTKENLNDLIFDLYDLGYLNKQRIKEYFTKKESIQNDDLENYKEALCDTLEMYFENKPIIECYQNPNLGFKMMVTVVYFNDGHKKMPSAEKKFKHIISKILEDSNEKFLAMREKIFGKNCIYIVKDNQYKNWSTSKAFEDGKEILRLLSV